MPVRRSPLLLPVAFAIGLRVALAIGAWLAGGTAAFLAGDSETYLVPAAHLAAHLELTNGLGAPEIFRTPGYPLLLAAGFVLAHPIVFALAAQLALAAGIVALTHALVRRLVDDPRIAAACAWAAALEPTMLIWSVKVMAETLFTILLLLFVDAALRALETKSPAWSIAAGCALTAAIYVRPIAYPLVPLLFLAALIGRGFFGVAVTWRQAFAFLLTCAVLLAPWHLRNFRRTGYMGFSTLFDHAVYLSAGGSVAARHEQKPFGEVRLRLLKAADGSPGAAKYESMRRRGWALFASDPGAYARIHLEGMARTLFSPGAGEYFGTLGVNRAFGATVTHSLDAGPVSGAAAVAKRFPLAFWSSLVLAVLLLPLLALPLIAATKLRPDQRPAFLLLLLVAGWLVTASGGVAGSSRFRAPIVPILIIMGSLAFARREAKPGDVR
jgi:4-amino-4-deoxy-L-arabinose transferase-like glycosyltransferase